LARKSRARLATGARALLDCVRATPEGLARLRGVASASADTVVCVRALADPPDAGALLFERLHFQHATRSTFARLAVPYMFGEATAAAVVTQPLTGPVARPAQDGAVALPWRQPAFAFFGS
jgi:hypothetical protein